MFILSPLLVMDNLILFTNSIRIKILIKLLSFLFSIISNFPISKDITI